MNRQEATQKLKRLGSLPSQNIDPAHAALLLSTHARGKLDLEAYTERLEEIASDCRDEAGPEGEKDLEIRAAVLNHIIHEKHGFAGDQDDYDDLDNADLSQVMDRKKGLPVALGILYITTAMRLGWHIEGLNFPGHFLIRLNYHGHSMIVDPFMGGPKLSAANLRDLIKIIRGNGAELTRGDYAAVSNRSVVLRLQTNIKARLVAEGLLDAALKEVNRMQLLAPKDADLWRQEGLIHLKRGDAPTAAEALSGYLQRAPGGRKRQEVARLLAHIEAGIT